MRRETTHYIENAFFYVILFFILREWLLPVVQLTETGELALLVIFLAICCVLNVLELPFIIVFFIKAIYIAWFIVNVYTGGVLTIFSFNGVQFLLDDITQNIGIVLSGQFADVTNPFRSFMFFLLIWMLVYLIDYWLKIKMTVFYFFVLTVFFIATLDTFTTYDGKFAIVKVVLLGLAMTAMLYLKRLITQTGTAFSIAKYIAYILPVILAIAVTGVVAVLLPKAAPQWPDPVPYIKSLSESSGGSGETIAKVGLGDDDTQLGGAFESDDTVIFTVEADTKQYWRVETKDLYTTKGWETHEAENLYRPVDPANLMLSIEPGIDVEKDVAFVQSNTDVNYILQPYGLVGIEHTQADVEFGMSDGTERIVSRTLADGTDITLTEYELSYQSPSYSYTALREPAVESTAMYIDARYLQLPAELPQRVRDLALEVTIDKTLPYDKAREIEQYFRRNSFSYETENVPVPTAEQDYVDQFLFETKRGYCDNFSTAMVVMLRANGIPARWVKGFAGGSEIERTENGQRVFQLENNDAHSWVEAYIDGVGWMTFEPTIGYSAPSQIDYDLEATPETPEQELQEQEQDRAVQEEVETEAATVKKQQDRSFTWLYMLGAGVGIAALIAFIRRRKWLPKVHIANQRRKKDDKEAVQLAYKVLLRQLEHAGLVRKPDETLSSFAQRVDMYFSTDDMSRVTDVYETSIYSEHAKEFAFDQIKESWEYLINATTNSQTKNKP